MKNQKLSQKIELAINEITRKLIENYRPEKIILFGSIAKGTFREDSDIDMLIIKQTDKKRFIDRWVEVLEIACDFELDVSFEPHVYTPGEIKKRLQLGDFFVEEILETGKVLYEK
jgi:predicted nucleotidyltransferase